MYNYVHKANSPEEVDIDVLHDVPWLRILIKWVRNPRPRDVYVGDTQAAHVKSQK